MSAFECCHNCPKKKGGCKPTCPDYIIAKAFHEVEKAERDKQKHIADGLYNQHVRAIRKHNKSVKRHCCYKV